MTWPTSVSIHSKTLKGGKIHRYNDIREIAKSDFWRAVYWRMGDEGSTVEPPIMDPPRGGHPRYNGHLSCYGLKIP